MSHPKLQLTLWLALLRMHGKGYGSLLFCLFVAGRVVHLGS